MHEPLISVVVVNWNRRELLRAALTSLNHQTCTDFEVVLVDNGSADGSVEMALEFATTAIFPLRIIRNDKNLGFCEANNQGIESGSSRFVALLNNDAEAEPSWLAALLEAFTPGREQIGMAASKILVWEDPRIIDKVGHLIWLDGQNRGRGAGQVDRGQFDQVEEVLWPDGCACMYRREMLDEIGGFDEDLFAYADDAELGLRARLAGWGCLYMPRAVVRHHRGSTLGVMSAQRIRLIERNRVLLAAKLFPSTLLWQNGVYYGARVAAGGWAALRKKGEIGRYSTRSGQLRAALALLQGMMEAIPMLPRFWRKRKDLERIRKLTPRQLTALLRRHQISLAELSENAAQPGKP